MISARDNFCILTASFLNLLRVTERKGAKFSWTFGIFKARSRLKSLYKREKNHDPGNPNRAKTQHWLAFSCKELLAFC